MMPLEASSLMGSIAGIAELVKTAPTNGLSHDGVNGRSSTFFWLSLGGLLLAAEMLGGNGICCGVAWQR